MWYLLSPPFYRCRNRFKKVHSLPSENKNSVLFSTVYLEANTLLAHSRCSVNGKWLIGDSLLIPTKVFSLKEWLRHLCFFPIPHERVVYLTNFLNFHHKLIYFCYVNKIFVFVFFFFSGKQFNLKLCFLVPKHYKCQLDWRWHLIGWPGT